MRRLDASAASRLLSPAGVARCCCAGIASSGPLPGACHYACPRLCVCVCSLVTDTLRGNYAIQDQRAGMAWVQRNVAAVGGDPTRVTLFGESAGAMSIGIHLTSPRSYSVSPPLFTAAIMESNVGE